MNQATSSDAIIAISCENKKLTLSIGDRTLPSFGLTPANIYALEEMLTQPEMKKLMVNGINLRVNGTIPDQDRPLYLELLRQVIYLQTTHCLYIKVSTKAPRVSANDPDDFEHYLNGLKNIPFFKDLCHAHILKGCAMGAPVVIVAPGPSIDIEMLKRLKGKACILATGRSLPRLVKGGVVPDYIYVQDTSERAWKDIFDYDESYGVLDSALIANPVGHIHQYAHRVKHLFKAWNYYPFEMDRLPKIDEIAPSSTSGAYSLATLFGGTEIIFMGNDVGGPGDPVVPKSIRCYDLDEILDAGTLPDSLYNQVAFFTITTPEGKLWTSCDYICGSQWLKTRIYYQIVQGGMRFFDNSSTGFIRDTGLVQPLPDTYEGDTYQRPPMPQYDPRFHPEQHLKKSMGRLAMIKRNITQNKPIPPFGFTQPYNCIFQGIKGYQGYTVTLTEEEKQMVLLKLDQLLDQLDTLVNMDWS